MKALLTFLLVSFSLTTTAINWEPFPYNQKNYFYFETQTEKIISPYYVDFEESDGNFTIQYPLRKMIETATDGCYEEIDLRLDSLKKGVVAFNIQILKKEGYFGYVYQTDEATDTIHFYPEVNVGESWEVIGEGFEESPFLYTRFKIKCINAESKLVLSVMDSVKTFEIEAYNEEIPGKSASKKFSIQLSKNHGLVEWYGFNEWVFSDLTTQITLAGWEDENGNVTGETLPKVSDFFPYTAGNVLKWKEITLVNGQYPTIYHTDSILSVMNTAMGIQYNYNRISTIIFPDTTLYESKLNEEINYEFFPQHFIDLHYWNLGIDLTSSYFYALNLKRIEIENAPTDYLLNLSYQRTLFGNCSTLYLEDLGTEKHTFSTAFGVELDSETGGFFDGFFHSIELQEAFVGEDYFTPIEYIVSPALNLTLSPNPSKDYVTIQKNSPFNTSIHLQIFNLRGQVIFKTYFDHSTEVNLLDFPKGVYLVKASNGKHQWTEKIVKY